MQQLDFWVEELLVKFVLMEIKYLELLAFNYCCQT